MSLRHSILALALGLFVAGSAIAQSAPAKQAPAVPATAQTATPAVPMLWKVSDADNSVYLLGSFHLLRESDYPLPVEFDRAFEDAESLLFEVAPAEMADPQKLMAAMQKVTGYSDGQSLSKVMSKASRDKLAALLKTAGQPQAAIDAMEQAEPWSISLGMALGMMQAMGFKAELGIDQHFMQRSARDGKPTGGLETIEVQLGALDAAPYAEQVLSLEEFLDDPGKSRVEMEKLHGAWRAGDVDTIDREMRAEMASKTPVSYRLVNTARNDAWLPQIEARLKAPGSTDDTLVVVGVLHLLGSDGLVEKLRARGYAVERLCDACKVK